MRKTLKKKVNGEEKSSKNSGEVESNGSLISDDISNHEDDSTAKKVSEAEDSDDGQSDHSEKSEKAAKSPKAKSKVSKKRGSLKAKKKATPKSKTETEYEVDKVVGVKEKKGKTLYLIRWKGYDKSSDTWEPESELNCPAKISAYLEANKKNDAVGEKEKEEEEEEDEEEKEEKEEKKKPKKETPGKKRKADTKKVAAKRAKAESSDSEEETKEYEVDKIIEVHHKRNGKKEYLVRWKGYSSKEDTWEPEEHLQCPELISKFNAKVEKGKEVGERELRVNPTHTEPYTLAMKSSGRRVSRRGDNKQRARYYEAE